MLLRDNIYRAIRHSILTCEYEPGQELREQVLADYYHVSRSPIRDSLLRLEHENLVTVLPRQGYRVNMVSIADVEEIYALRLLVEPACAAAAARRDDAVAGGLERFRGFAANGPRDAAFGEYNQAFHEAVADLSNNTRLAAVAHDLFAQFDRLVRISMFDDELTTVAQAVREHNALIDAIEAHDAETASCLAYKHVDAARPGILAALESGGGMRKKPTPNCQIPNGQTESDHAGNSHAGNGQAGNGQAGNGQTANGVKIYGSTNGDLS